MIILACEGPSEVVLINKLLDDNALIFDRKDILDRRPIHFRQPKIIAPLINTLPIDEPLIFYRIGDTQKDKYDYSCLSFRSDRITEYKVCTKPEIEILVIIKENLYEKYLKTKSKVQPKQFLKNEFNGLGSFSDYILKNDMIDAIKKYKNLKRHKKDEMFLAELLR